ncbi:MAG: sugar phosphate isomerase/epimerase, partial [Anaerolineae bacterium]
MPISLSTASLYIYPLRKTFELAKRAGFDGVELVISPEVEWRGPEYVRRLSNEYALPILTVHPPLLGFPGWRQIHTSIAPYFDKAVRITRGVGAPLMVIHMPRAQKIDDPVGHDFVDKVVKAQTSHNGDMPRLALENMSRFIKRDSGYILRTLPDLRAFADEYDFPMTLDTAHVGTWDLDLLDSINYFDGRLGNIHFSDLCEAPEWVMKRPRLHSYLRQHQLPGAGHLP